MPPSDPMLRQYQVEQFYYAEAELLDDRRYDEWFALLEDDIRYFMPMRFNRGRREMHLEFSDDRQSAYYDEDKESMAVRQRKLACGSNWAEDPPSRTRHMIGNVRIADGALPGELSVKSAFLVYRNRLERQTEIFAGERQDVLRIRDGGFRIARRTVLLDQATLLTSSLSIFF